MSVTLNALRMPPEVSTSANDSAGSSGVSTSAYDSGELFAAGREVSTPANDSSRNTHIKVLVNRLITMVTSSNNDGEVKEICKNLNPNDLKEVICALIGMDKKQSGEVASVVLAAVGQKLTLNDAKALINTFIKMTLSHFIFAASVVLEKFYGQLNTSEQSEYVTVIIRRLLAINTVTSINDANNVLQKFGNEVLNPGKDNEVLNPGKDNEVLNPGKDNEVINPGKDKGKEGSDYVNRIISNFIRINTFPSISNASNTLHKSGDIFLTQEECSDYANTIIIWFVNFNTESGSPLHIFQYHDTIVAVKEIGSKLTSGRVAALINKLIKINTKKSQFAATAVLALVGHKLTREDQSRLLRPMLLLPSNYCDTYPSGIYPSEELFS